MPLYIGTSGWAYKEWKPAFYPEKLPATKFLRHYALELTACEINATFYGMQRESSFQKWAAETPDAFRFTVKAHGGITHGKAVAGDPELLAAFLRSLAPLGKKLGAVLFQLPPHRKRDDVALDRLLGLLPEGLPFALEFRHESWESSDVSARVRDAGGTVCLADTDGEVPVRLPEGGRAYIRLRADRYDETTRSGWLALLRGEAASRDVYAFARHKDLPAGDPLTGVGMAQWLAAQVREAR